MEHIAIDLGLRESQLCVRDAQGAIIEEQRIPTTKLSRYLSQRAPGRVIVETSAEAFHVADQALALGHEVKVVPATLVRALGVGERGIKTDQRDARKLSEVSVRVDLPSVHVPTLLSRDRKALCNSRQVLVEVRTKLSNHARGYLRRRALVVPIRGARAFPDRIRTKLLAQPEGMPAHLEWVLSTLEQLNGHIEAADEELRAIAERDDVCKRLMTVPGVGPVIAVRFVAAIDQPERFGSAHDVMSYLGLTPGENSSSQRKQRTAITKAGAADLRFALVQGAWAAMRCRRVDPMIAWAHRIAQRRNNKVAAVALARKLVGVMWAIWRDGGRYIPARAADAQEVAPTQ
jgi:transposase